ncbi:MAG TPA: RDD family protein [Candidatus Acidoferrum sp.]|nr:RDD family protein [Candidatus Acidoferrum sp.]
MAERFQANRTRRGKSAESNVQAQFLFEDSPAGGETRTSIAIEEGTPPKEEFSFTIAIGKSAKANPCEDLPMQIDVSSRPHANGYAPAQLAQTETDPQSGLYPVASFDDRRLAGLIDFFCLAFAYGGFLGLFGSLGGHFTLSKLSAAVCIATFAVVYMQYFALFTIFGGTTPGMMMRGLQVVSFSGDTPAPRQMILRSVGYMLSAGTFFLGFLWAMWDSDELTWHDRLSRTYLSVEQTLPELEASDAARGR